jgi:hypothetical protein
MADNLNSPSFEFSIENTMEMGMGNSELLSDLFEPETSTSSPDGLEKIVKEVEDAAPAKTKPASVKTIGDDVVATDKEEEDTKDAISDFLSQGDDDDEEERGN